MNIKKILSVLMVSSSALMFSVAAYSGHHNEKSPQEKPQTITYNKTELAKGIFMFQGQGGFTGGNIVLLDGSDGVVIIDDGMPQFLNLLNKHIKQAVGKPIDYIINTHLHGDHTGNNAAFAKTGSKIIAHDNVRAKMAAKEDADSHSLPVFTFNDKFTSHINGQRMQAIHVHAAHTNGDAFVHFADANVIHTGDIFFNGMFPFIDLDNGGSVSGYIAAQKAILKLANSETKIVPGHGPLATKAELRSALEMLVESHGLVEQMLSEGNSEQQVVAANPLKAFHEKWNWGFITTEKMTRTLYKSITAGNPSGKHHH